MMDFFRFIKWWWGELETLDQWAISAFCSVPFLILGCYLYGPVVLLGLLGLILGTALFFLLKGPYRYFSYKWQKYKRMREDEERIIIERLSRQVMTETDHDNEVLIRLRQLREKAKNQHHN